MQAAFILYCCATVCMLISVNETHLNCVTSSSITPPHIRLCSRRRLKLKGDCESLEVHRRFSSAELGQRHCKVWRRTPPSPQVFPDRHRGFDPRACRR